MLHAALARVYVAGRILGLLIDQGHHPVNFFGDIRGAVGQRTHFIGDDREASATVTGPCRLDGRVQRQEVGLIGDLADQADRPGDFFGAQAEPGDRLGRAIDGRGDLGDFRGNHADGPGTFLCQITGLEGLVAGGRNVACHRADALG